MQKQIAASSSTGLASSGTLGAPMYVMPTGEFPLGLWIDTVKNCRAARVRDGGCVCVICEIAVHLIATHDREGDVADVPLAEKRRFVPIGTG